MEVSETSSVTPRPDDNVVIQVHLYNPAAKPSPEVLFRPQLTAAVDKDKRKNPQVLESCNSLKDARAVLLAKLESATDGEQEVQASLETYLGLLMGLVNRLGASSTAPDGPATGSCTVVGDSQLRQAVPFAWRDSLLPTAPPASMQDSAFELASVLVAVAVWHMRRAAHLCNAASSGATTDRTVKAYHLLQVAAGLLRYVRESCAQLLPACPSPDLDPAALSGLANLALADAQSLTVLRAVQKGNGPSLIAALAVDTATLYRTAQAAIAASGAGAAGGRAAQVPAAKSKAALYCGYKAVAFHTYALLFHGLALMKEGQAGGAVRCLQQAAAQRGSTADAALEMDRAAPRNFAADREAFDAALAAAVAAALKKCTAENERVYFQPPPKELPALPDGKRLVTAVTYALPGTAAASGDALALAFLGASSIDAVAAAPNQLPTNGTEQQGPDASANGAAAASDSAKPADAAAPTAAAVPIKPVAASPQEGGGGCCRWLLVIIAFPLLVLVSLVGIVVWLLLLPLKICCCPIGCAIQLVWDVVEWVVKAPLRAMLWASGKPWRPEAKEGGRASDDKV